MPADLDQQHSERGAQRRNLRGRGGNGVEHALELAQAALEEANQRELPGVDDEDVRLVGRLAQREGFREEHLRLVETAGVERARRAASGGDPPEAGLARARGGLHAALQHRGRFLRVAITQQDVVPLQRVEHREVRILQAVGELRLLGEETAAFVDRRRVADGLRAARDHICESRRIAEPTGDRERVG